MTQKDWAEMMGVTPGYVYQVERGITKPSLEYLRAVGRSLGFNLHWIITGEGPRVVIDEAAIDASVQVAKIAAGTFAQVARKHPEITVVLEELFFQDDGERWRALLAIRGLSEKKRKALIDLIEEE